MTKIMEPVHSLAELGWQPFFQQQLSLEELEVLAPARVFAQHRSGFELETETGRKNLAVAENQPKLTVGDWLLLDDQGNFERALDRLSLFSRKASGAEVKTQLIAANVDTAFIVCSLNQDFNLSRIERYLALAREAGAEPVIVLTKADCCENPTAFVDQVRALDPMLMVEAVNGLDAGNLKQLQPWLKCGKTVVLLGSSGVGKSTLINTFSGGDAQLTAAIREDDSKGRHTTTTRSLHLLPAGALLLDTPGMRELQILDCEQGIADTFSAIISLAQRCKFSDCRHQGEPGCAVNGAVEAGELSARRLTNYFKLLREEAVNRASLAEKRSHDRQLGRMYRTTQAHGRRLKEED